MINAAQTKRSEFGHGSLKDTIAAWPLASIAPPEFTTTRPRTPHEGQKSIPSQFGQKCDINSAGNTLATCGWIREAHGLLLQGPPGVGKTHLCVALGTRAIENGFSVCFYRVDEFMYQLKQDVDVSPARLKHKKYMASNLLILDEFGYQSLDRQEANLLFRVVNYRYQRGSIALTTNKGITSWPEVLAGDEVLAGAILDRLLHSATVLNIQGRSYRLQDMEANLGSVSRAAATPVAVE